MKIKLLTARATATGAQNRGAVVDVTDAEAVRMIEAGQAEPVRRDAPEKAVKPVRAEKAARN
jgi:hypothetical protein